MKRKTKIISISVIIFILFSIIITLFVKHNIEKNPYLRVRLYIGDRITGDLTIKINNERYYPEYLAHEFMDEGTSRLAYDSEGFHIKGGEYGDNKIIFSVEKEKAFNLTNDEFFNQLDGDILFTFSYINANWWNITEINIEVDILQDDKGWYADIAVTYTEQSEKGGENTYNIDKKVYIADETDIFIRFGI